MRTLTLVAVFLLTCSSSFAQKTKVPAKKYPSLLWEISGNGLKKPSYLFGTMHVSSKMVFHLSDSFYIGLKSSDVVALETDMGKWQEDFSRYDLDGESGYSPFLPNRNLIGSPEDFLTIGRLKFPSYEKTIEMALYSSPSIINNFLYRNYSERAADFEEDTYLDMHIYQAGKKWGKKVVGVEDFDESMQLMKEAYEDAAKEKNKKERSYDYDEDFSYAKLEDAYRTGNLDWLDSINKVNSQSAAFDEKFLYKRNDIQAESIDSILKTRQTLFVGVGAAHLPGERGVIEILRRMGYKLRPIKMTERDSRHKDEVEKIRVPVQFDRQASADGFFSVELPGKLYAFGSSFLPFAQSQFADMSNGSYYVVTRINTNSLMWGHNESTVLRKIDSVMYENIPGKILSRTSITRNGYKGFEIHNRTRRGDYQRYNIFATPFEILIFKMSGNGDYVKEGTEADQFFGSIVLKEYKTNWQKWSPPFGGFEAEFAHEPVITKQHQNWQFMSYDANTRTSFHVIRTDIHNYEFVEEDSFDLALMEESFASSEFIDRQLSRRQTNHGGYSALDAKYRYKDGSTALVRFLVQNTHYYTIIAQGRKEQPAMSRFLNSFAIKPFVYGTAEKRTDTSLYFTVVSPVPLEKPKKLSLYPENMYNLRASQDEDYLLDESTTYKSRLVADDSTGERIYISFSKPARYHYDNDSTARDSDTTVFKTHRMEWVYRSRKTFTLPNNTDVFEYVLGDPKSSRYVWGKLFSRDGIEYRLETGGDTISAPSAFVSKFFETFTPSDTVRGVNPKEKKTALFFGDFFSKDTMQHKRAVRNVSRLDFDSTDFSNLRKAIGSLSWSEKKYLDVKKDFIWQLAFVKSKESSDYLRDLYFSAGDTIELQYTVLETLLSQKTAYAYGVFRDIMVSDPPVLGLNTNNSYSPYGTRSFSSYTVDYDPYERSGYFIDNLNDTLELTAGVFKDLLPLLNVNDYEEPMMELLKALVDSNMIAAKDYDIYLSKFLIEAKQLMKKQVINEKSKQIEKAQEDDDDEESYPYYRNNTDYGNEDLHLYATLLIPFWDKNPAIPQLVNQMLASTDKRLKYNTMMLLLHNGKAVPDTMFSYFAGMDEYRYELYRDLKEKDQLRLFPAKYNNHIDLAKGSLLRNSYDRPDTVVYINKIKIHQNDRVGYVYFFKYKKKKDDASWKLASVGLVPTDPGKFLFEKKKTFYEERKYDFTGMLDTKIEEHTPIAGQLKKALKKMQYATRNSAAQFYSDEDKDGFGMDFLRGVNFGD